MSYFSQALSTKGSCSPVSRLNNFIGRPPGPLGLQTHSNDAIWPPYSPCTSSALANCSKLAISLPFIRTRFKGPPALLRYIFWAEPGVTSTPVKLCRSTGSGEVDQVPPNTSG